MNFVELGDYLRVLRKYWVSLVALIVVGLGAGVTLSMLATPTYTASSQLFLTVQSGDTAGELAQGSTYAERQVKSFAEVAVAPIVLQPVIDGLGLSVTPAQLAARVTVSVPTSTAVLDVSVTDADAERAAATAGAIADQLVVTVADLAPKDDAGRAGVEATITSPASVPTAWTTPRVAQNVMLGLLVGAMLGFGQALVRKVLDTRVRNADDVAYLTDAPIVGTVAFDPDADTTPLTVVRAPNSLRAEEYRRLRTNLQFLGTGEAGKAIAITSSLEGEGKTSTVLNAAVALAAAGKRVLLVDADLRRPRVADRLDLEGVVGVTTILIGRATLADVTQHAHGMDVLAAGQVPPNPSELLGSEAMASLVREARQQYDYVLLDSAPLVPVADTAVLATLLDGLVVVVGSGEVHAAQLEDALGSVEAAEGKILGIVLNKIKAADAGDRRNVYYYRGTYADSESPPDAAPAGGEPREPNARAVG